MALVSYTNLEDGNAAGANDINQRFGDILGQLNGNLDAQNIKNGSLTRELLSPDANLASWPVDSVYLSVDSANPSTKLGGGTWVLIAQGRALVGVDPSDSDFNEAEKTTGTKTVSLTGAQNGPHTHSVDPPNATTSSSGAHTHTMGNDVFITGSSTLGLSGGPFERVTFGTRTTSSSGAHTHTLNIPAFNSASSGSGAPHNNVQPSFALYVFKRVA